MHTDAGADQGRSDLCLEIGEGKNEIRLKRENFRDIGKRKGGHARLFAPGLLRAHHKTRNADDAMLFAEQVKRLDGLFGQADDPLRREQIKLRWIP